ncbi:tetratricopeptide repeat protein [Chitinophaga sp. MM2321]|uniref:tetratricopeptide repeat protein n=1 Tax=Chitinophaga sp. MM2321 TaxID=3137178 RepID=UPI0032D56FB0
MTRRLILCIHLLMLGIAVNTVLAHPVPVVHDKARDLYKEGMAFKKSGNQEAALQRFVAAISADSSFTAAYSELGDIYFDRKSYEAALLYSRKAQQLGAEMVSRLIGLSFYHLHQYENALEALQQARNEEPDNQLIPYQLAQIYAQLGDYRASIHYYREDLVIDSTHTNAWYELGMMFFNTADFSAAATSFEKAAALGYKQDALFLLNTGVTWLRLQQTDKGIDYLCKAQAINPRDEQIMYNLARAWYDKGNFKEASLQYEQVLYLQPTNAFVMFMLGKSYIGNGEEVKGGALCDKALSLGLDKTNIK